MRNYLLSALFGLITLIAAAAVLRAMFQSPPASAKPPQQQSANVVRTMAELPEGSAPLGLEGFCPVILVERKIWRRGDAQFVSTYAGRSYVFTSDEGQQKFESDPDRFAPVMAGLDVVHFTDDGKHVEGKRDFGVVYRQRIYLFATAAARDAFEESPEQYVASAQQAADSTESVTR